MRKFLITATVVLFSMFQMQGQVKFYPAVKIEFEKTISVRQLMKDLIDDPAWFELYKERYPVSSLSYFDFTGDSSHSLYKPGREVAQEQRFSYRPVADKNVVYNDYTKGTTISQKPVYDETFLMEDSLTKIKWKLTGDVRNIAGFDCRKAIGTINDSITVFAFYTDELLITGGPEGVNGLPGMILGMGIPRLHITWFATKVEVLDSLSKQPLPPAKGKKVSRKEMMAILEKLANDWGGYGKKTLLNFVI